MINTIEIEQVWAEYRSQLKGFLIANISDSDDVEDVLQMILIKTFDNLHTVKSPKALKSWLFQITKNTLKDFYRKRSASPEFKQDISWYAEEAKPDLPDLAKCIIPFIQALPTETASLLEAVDIQGVSQKDYATTQGVSYSTLKSRVQKGREQIRKLFEDCCHLSIDTQGNVFDMTLKSGDCEKC